MSCIFCKKTPETLVFYSSWVKVAFFLDKFQTLDVQLFWDGGSKHHLLPLIDVNIQIDYVVAVTS